MSPDIYRVDYYWEEDIIEGETLWSLDAAKRVFRKQIEFSSTSGAKRWMVVMEKGVAQPDGRYKWESFAAVDFGYPKDNDATDIIYVEANEPKD